MKRTQAAWLIVTSGISLYACGGGQFNSRNPPPAIPIVKNQDTPADRPMSRQEDLKEEQEDVSRKRESKERSLTAKIPTTKWKGCCPGVAVFSPSDKDSKEKIWKNAAYIKVKSLSFKSLQGDEVKTEKVVGGYYHDEECRDRVTPAELKALGLAESEDRVESDAIEDLTFSKNGREASGFHTLYQKELGGQKEKTLQPIKLKFGSDQLTYSIIYEPNSAIGDDKGFKQDCSLEPL